MPISQIKPQKSSLLFCFWLITAWILFSEHIPRWFILLIKYKNYLTADSKSANFLEFSIPTNWFYNLMKWMNLFQSIQKQRSWKVKQWVMWTAHGLPSDWSVLDCCVCWDCDPNIFRVILSKVVTHIKNFLPETIQ